MRRGLYVGVLYNWGVFRGGVVGRVIGCDDGFLIVWLKMRIWFGVLDMAS